MSKSDKSVVGAMLKAAFPKKTGVCQWCGKDILNHRSDAKFCSGACRTAACTAKKPTRNEIIIAQRAEIAALKAENASLTERLRQDGTLSVASRTRHGRLRSLGKMKGKAVGRSIYRPSEVRRRQTQKGNTKMTHKFLLAIAAAARSPDCAGSLLWPPAPGTAFSSRQHHDDDEEHGADHGRHHPCRPRASRRDRRGGLRFGLLLRHRLSPRRGAFH